MADTIKTRLHWYQYDMRKPEEKAAYKALCAKLRATHTHPMEAFENGTPDGWDYKHIMPLDGKVIELETAHLFENQWNTGPTATSDKGLRVFDWRKIVPFPRDSQHIKRGHWLEITPEMREIRRNTMKCGYCGKQEPAAKGNVFCPHCIGSEYLKESDLLAGATRMKAVDTPFSEGWTPLTEAESAHLVPIYRAEQKGQGSARSKARHAAKRAAIVEKCNTVTANAIMERDGLLWCADRGLVLDNIIFYSHTRRFCFGWRNPLTGSELQAVLDEMSEFPFLYELKCADGRHLQNEAA